MTDSPRNNAEETQGRVIGRPFQPGNPGRPPGARHKATLAAEALLDGEAEGLTRKCVEAALAGDMGALRICMDRILPARKERPVNFQIPPLQSAEDAAAAMAAITEAVAGGELTLAEADTASALVERFVRTLEAGEFEKRLRALEAAGAGNGRQWPPRNERAG
jgi:hypothetical protein